MTNNEIVKSLQQGSFNRELMKKMISSLDEQSVIELKDTGFTSDIRSYSRGRLQKINQKKNIENALKDIKSYTLSVNKAARKHGVAVNYVRDAVERGIPNYDPSLIRYKREPKKYKVKDRLHYHKWDGSLKIKREFFEEIKENVQEK